MQKAIQACLGLVFLSLGLFTAIVVIGDAGVQERFANSFYSDGPAPVVFESEEERVAETEAVSLKGKGYSGSIPIYQPIPYTIIPGDTLWRLAGDQWQHLAFHERNYFDLDAAMDTTCRYSGQKGLYFCNSDLPGQPGHTLVPGQVIDLSPLCHVMEEVN